METAGKSRLDTNKVIQENDERFIDCMNLFKKEINQAIQKGQYKCNIFIKNPSKLAMLELKELGYKIDMIYPQPRNFLEKDLMKKNPGAHWGCNLVVNW